MGVVRKEGVRPSEGLIYGKGDGEAFENDGLE
jgi:hypothetical protein